MSSSAVRPGPAPAPEDRGQYVEFERFIDRRIQQTRGQVKFVDLSSGVLVWLSAAVLFLLAAALVDAWVWPLPGWGRFAFWLAAIGGSLWYLGTRVAPLLLRRINPLYAAAAIERGKPTLKNSVVNFLLLRDAPVPAAVFEAVERQAAAGLAHAPPEESVDRGVIVRLGYVLLALVLLAALYTVASPKDPLRTVARVFLPWADIPPPARVTLLSVVPGDVEAFHGQQVDVKVEAEGNADAATLFYTTADGTRVDQPIPLHRAEGAVHFAGLLPETDAGLQQDLLYHVQVGDALSPKYRVKVLATPTITVDSIEYHYPAYTGMATHRVEKQGDIEALEGTKVVIRATANGDIKSAHIDLKSDKKFDQPLRFEGRSAELTLPLVIPPEHGPRPYLSSYELRFTNAAGHSTRQPIRYSLAVTPDLPPEARFLQPLGAEVDVPENAAIVLETSAIDPDFALRRVVLSGTKNDQPVFEQKLLDEVRSGQFGHKFTFAPARYKLVAGDDVVLQARAEDNRLPKPGTGRSTELLIHVVAADPRAERQPREGGHAGEEPPPEEEKTAEEPKQPKRQRQEERSGEQDNDQGEGQQDDQKTRQQPSKQRNPQQQGQQEKTDDGPQQDQQSGEGGQGGGEGGQSGGKQSGSDGQQGQGAEGQSGSDQQQAEGGEQGQGGQQGAKGGQSSKSAGREAGDSQGEEGGQGGEPNQGGQSGKGRQGKQSGGAGSQQGESGKDSANEPVTNDGDAYEKILDHLKQKDGQQGDQQQGKQADGQKQNGNQQQNSGGKQSQRGERGQGKQASEQAGDQGQQAEGEGNADQQGKGAPGAGEKQQPQSRPGSRQQQPQGDKNQGGEAGADEGQGQAEGQAGGESGKAGGEKQAGSKNSRSQPQPDESGKQGVGQGDAGQEPGAKTGQKRPQERADDEGAKGAGNEAGKDAAGEDAKGGEGQAPGDRQGGQSSQQSGGKQGQAGKHGQSGKQSGKGEQGAGKSQPGDQGQPQQDAQQGKGNNSPGTTRQQNGDAPKDQGQQKQRGQANERPQNQQDSDAGDQQGDDSAEPATGENGQPGAGRPDQGKGGTPQPQGQNEPKPKTHREGAKQKPKEGDSPRGASDSNKQSDTQGDGDTGQQSGGGNTGGGQSADNQGKGSAGENTPDNEGAGRSQEQGPGETGEGPGQQDEATSPTGESSKDGKRGNGSKSAPGDRGQQPGQSPPENQKSGDQPGSGKTQPGQGRQGQPNTGAQGEPNRQPPGPRPEGPRDAGQEPGGDDANLEYADKATDLVLERLRNDLNKGKTDAELLRKLGWSKDDLAKFVRRWEEMKRSARTADTPAPKARRELDAALRSLGLRPAGAKVGSSAAGDTERGLRESRNSRPPAEFEDAFRAYSRGVSGGKAE